MRREQGRNRDLGSSNDRELQHAMIGGDVDAAAEVYRRYADRVRRAAYAVVGDETLATDVGHDVFLELLDRPERWDPSRSPLGAFVVMLAHRRAVDAVRRTEAARRRERWAGDLGTVIDERVEVASERKELRRSVRCAVDRLPGEQRDVVEGAYFGERSYRQAARDLGIPEGTAKTRLRAALATLREYPELRALT